MQDNGQPIGRLRPSARIARGLPPLEAWMVSAYGLALPLTSCDAELYASIYAASKDGVGVFDRSMSAFARLCGYSRHTVAAARRRLESAGLIERAQDAAGEPVKASRPGKPVWHLRAVLPAASVARFRFESVEEENLTAIDAALKEPDADGDTWLGKTGPEGPDGVRGVAETKGVETPSADKAGADRADESGVPCKPASPEGRAEAHDALPHNPCPAPAPLEDGEEDSVDALLEVLSARYPKPGPYLDGGKNENALKQAVKEVSVKYALTPDEVGRAVELRLARAEANNPELFAGNVSEHDRWRYLPNLMEFVSRPKNLAALVNDLRRMDVSAGDTCRSDAINAVRPACAADDTAAHVARGQSLPAYPGALSMAGNQDYTAWQESETRRGLTAQRAQECEQNPSAAVESIIAESRYRFVPSGLNGRGSWIVTCDHGTRGGYMSWEVVAESEPEARARHRDLLEAELGLARKSVFLSSPAPAPKATAETREEEPSADVSGCNEGAWAPALGAVGDPAALADLWRHALEGLSAKNSPTPTPLERLNALAVSDDGEVLTVEVDAPSPSTAFVHKTISRDSTRKVIWLAVCEVFGRREVVFRPRPSSM